MFEIHRERVYACSVETLWQAVATAEGLAGWLMANDFEPRVGHEFTFRSRPSPGFDGVVHAKVLQLEAPRHLRFAWRSGRIETEVALTIESVQAQLTRLRIAHTGFGGASGLVARVMLGFGWSKLLRQNLSRWLQATAEKAT